MADQSYNRPYRANEPDRRRGTQAPSAAPGNDPLAELARLIGQNDPFAEFPPGGSRQHDDPAVATASADWRSAQPAQDEFSRRPSAPSSSYYDERYADDDARDGESATGDTYYNDPGYSERNYVEPDPQEEPYPDHNQSGYQEQSGYDPAGRDQSSYARDARDARGYRAKPAYPERQSHPRREAYAEQGPHSQNGSYAQPYAQNDQYSEEDSYSQHDAHDPTEHDDPYDDPPPVRRRGGLVTVVAVLGLAVVGTAGAFTYRATLGKATPPPVIKNNPTPTKLVVNQTSDAQPSKPIQERVERIVPHEEAPIDVQQAVTPEPPAPTPPMGLAPNVRQATSNTPPPSLAWAPSPAPQSPAAAPAPAAPKRIHTVPIKPPDSDAGPGPVNILSTANRVAPSKPPAAAANAPLSLTPGAPARAAAPASAPTRLASGSSGAEGGFLVQVSSQRSESDAQASFRSLKTKYAEVIGDREPVIRRADLGDKGVYYRALVGGFGTAQEAGQFCDSLKAAGGSCLIQKN